MDASNDPVARDRVADVFRDAIARRDAREASLQDTPPKLYPEPRFQLDDERAVQPRYAPLGNRLGLTGDIRKDLVRLWLLPEQVKGDAEYQPQGSGEIGHPFPHASEFDGKRAMRTVPALGKGGKIEPDIAQAIEATNASMRRHARITKLARSSAETFMAMCSNYTLTSLQLDLASLGERLDRWQYAAERVRRQTPEFLRLALGARRDQRRCEYADQLSRVKQRPLEPAPQRFGQPLAPP
jgi:hypothetical protein